VSDKDAWSFQVALYFGPRIGRKGAWLTGAVKQKTLKAARITAKPATNNVRPIAILAWHSSQYMNLTV